jgi:hypothetical protein
MDGDGLEEAFVFYAYRSAPLELRLKILKQSEPGVWYSFHDIAGSGNEIEFVKFAPIHENSPDSLIIGWQNTQRQRRIGIYTMRERFEEDLLERADAYIIYDFGDVGTNDILISQRRGDSHILRLLSSRRGRVIEVAEAVLYFDTTSVIQILRGRLWDGSTGVYIDQRIDNAFYGTEVYRVDGNSLTPLSAGNVSRDDPSWPIYTATFREENVLSVHLAGMDYVEVPRVGSLPGSERFMGELRLPPLIQYMRLGEGGFDIFFNAVINPAGYLVFFPPAWMDNVTLVEIPENNEWSFRRFDHETERASTELFRIRVHSTEDFLDPFTENEFLLASRGVFRYYGFIPQAFGYDELIISQEQAQNMFMLVDTN